MLVCDCLMDMMVEEAFTWRIVDDQLTIVHHNLDGE